MLTFCWSFLAACYAGTNGQYTRQALLKYLRELRLELTGVRFDVVVVDRIDRDLIEPRQPFRRRHVRASRRTAVFGQLALHLDRHVELRKQLGGVGMGRAFD